MKVKKSLLILSILILAGISELIEAGENKAWYGFNAGMALAKKENKHVVIDFYTEWCGWCKVMDQKTFSDAVVSQFLFSNFIPIRINAEDDKDKLSFQGKTYTARELTRAFKVTGFPSIAFLSPQMEILGIIPGYIEKDRFLNLLKYVQQECYKTDLSFEEFVKNGCRSPKNTVKP